MTVEAKCGLYTKAQAVPLTGVRVEATLSGASLEVTVTQRYHNRESVPVEAVYVFPLDESAAVCGFAARLGDTLVRGHVEERERAFARYDDAVHAGDGAFLLDQERPNVFTASLGNLRPGEVVELELRYVAVVQREGRALRLTIPTTVSPRYVPAGPVEVGEPEGERVNPERWSRVPYGLALRVDVAAGALASVESPSHPVRTSFAEGSATVELAQDDVALDRDFVLLVTPRDAGPLLRVAREADGRRVAMLSFLPAELSREQGGSEVVFLLDCSGSMQGESIAQAKRALALCIRALGEGDRFNVVCFGSSYRTLWPAPRAFDDHTLDEASRYVAAIDADLGGTEVLAPLRALCEAATRARPSRILLLTDGQVSNEGEIIALARKHAAEARIFAFGIGAGASEYLVRGVARASRGAAEMIFPGERIEPKVLRMFKRVRTPPLGEVRVDYGGLTVTQAPAQVPPVFEGDLVTVFARIDSGHADRVALCVGDRRYEAPIDLEHAEADGPIPTLWARESIRELDDDTVQRGSRQRRDEAADRKRARLVELGTRYGLTSSATSFVAVEQRADADKTTSPAELRRIPVALTDGWGSGAERSRGGPPIMPMMLAAAPAPGAPKLRARAMFTASAVRPSFEDEASGMDLEAPPPALYSAAPVSSRPPAAPSDPLFDLLMTQRADGRFERSPALSAWLGARVALLEDALSSAPEAAVVTSLVLLLLEREVPQRRDEWLPAADKARAFLAKQGAPFDASALLS